MPQDAFEIVLQSNTLGGALAHVMEGYIAFGDVALTLSAGEVPGVGVDFACVGFEVGHAPRDFTKSAC